MDPLKKQLLSVLVKRFFFATVTTRKLRVFEIYNGAYLYLSLKYCKFGK